MVCHQRPERSFHSNGARWPVCARCSGLYLSAALGTVVAWLPGRRRSRVAFHAWRVPLVAAALPTLVTLGLEWWRPAWSTPALRAITAVPLGFVVGALLAESMSFRGKLEGCVRMPSSE
jgi:uncharacterized membrane protein